MNQDICRQLYDYWNSRRGGARAPQRGDIEPAAIRTILGDTFILELAAPGDYRFRLAGTRVCAAYCSEIKGRGFLDLWPGADAASLRPLLAAVTDDAAAAVIGLDGFTERDQSVSFEMLILPLRQPGQACDRFLGALAPVTLPYWLGMVPIVRQELTSLKLITPDHRPGYVAGRGAASLTVRRPPPPPHTARRGRFVVLTGGKA